MKHVDSPLAAASEVASKITYTGAGASVVGTMAKIDWVSWVGVAVAVIGLIVNIYFKWREDKRQRDLVELKKSNLRKGCSDE